MFIKKIPTINTIKITFKKSANFTPKIISYLSTRTRVPDRKRNFFIFSKT